MVMDLTSGHVDGIELHVLSYGMRDELPSCTVSVGFFLFMSFVACLAERQVSRFQTFHDLLLNSFDSRNFKNGLRDRCAL